MSREGWKCPTCGSVYAPWVYKCTNCPGTYGSAAGTFVEKPCEHTWRQDSDGSHCTKCGERIGP